MSSSCDIPSQSTADLRAKRFDLGKSCCTIPFRLISGVECNVQSILSARQDAMNCLAFTVYRENDPVEKAFWFKEEDDGVIKYTKAGLYLMDMIEVSYTGDWKGFNKCYNGRHIY